LSDPRHDVELLELARLLSARESGLAVAVTLRVDGSAHASVVNAGVLDDPITGHVVIGFVVRGDARKLTFIRSRPQVTVVFRSGWEWVSIEGSARLLGPDDENPLVDDAAVPDLIHRVYAAAVGGAPDEWEYLDDMFAAERHTVVLVSPLRVYSNPAVP
jgi:hypothetical protein